MVQFHSDQHNFFVILKSQFPIKEKVHDGDPKVHDEIILKENILNQFENFMIQDKTLSNIVWLFNKYSYVDVFGRQEISNTLSLSIERSAKLLKQMIKRTITLKTKGR